MRGDLATVLPQALAHRQRTTLARPDKTVAAVLVPLLLLDGEPHLLYIRRAHDLPHHRGQIAFPGGRHQAEDPTLEATALREASEEIGLAPGDVRLLGALDDTETMGSRFVITPFVAIVPYPYDCARARARSTPSSRCRSARSRHRARSISRPGTSGGRTCRSRRSPSTVTSSGA